MEENTRQYHYALTGDPDEADHAYHYSPEVAQTLSSCHKLVQRSNPKVLPRLIKLIKKYPRVPALQNYLSVYYEQLGNHKKAVEINKKIVQKFPDYLMAKINLANEYITKQEYDEVPSVLGEALDLQSLYPDRRVFHYNEFVPYMQVVMRYFFATEQIPAVTSRMPMLRELLGKDHELMEWIGYQLQVHLAFPSGGSEDSSIYEEREYDTSLATTVAPAYKHPEVAKLTEQSLDEAEEHFPAILQLPRETLVADLQTMLKDAIRRYPYWQDQMEEYEIDFPMSAILLLMELEEDACLEILLDHLRQGRVFLDDWYGDFITEEYWRFLYPAGKRRVSDLVDFLQEPNLHVFARLAVAATLNQIAVHDDARWEEVKGAYRDVMTYYLNHQEDKVNLCDPEFCGFLTIEVVIFDDEEIIALTRRFYEEELCHPEFDGGFAERMKEFKNPQVRGSEKRKLPATTAVANAQRLIAGWYRN
jgi:tetratricopeptide (TPR) repeat protein